MKPNEDIDDKFEFSKEELEEIIEYALTYGLDRDYPPVESLEEDMEDMINEIMEDEGLLSD